MIRSFDKLFPDNFRLSVGPELLEGMDTANRDRAREFATREKLFDISNRPP